MTTLPVSVPRLDIFLPCVAGEYHQQAGDNCRTHSGAGRRAARCATCTTYGAAIYVGHRRGFFDDARARARCGRPYPVHSLRCLLSWHLGDNDDARWATPLRRVHGLLQALPPVRARACTGHMTLVFPTRTPPLALFEPITFCSHVYHRRQNLSVKARTAPPSRILFRSSSFFSCIHRHSY